VGAGWLALCWPGWLAAGRLAGCCASTTAGQTPKSLAAMRNLKKVCEEHLPPLRDRIHRSRAESALAKEHQIVAIPTLVRKLPTRFAGSSATFPIRVARWSGWICSRGPQSKRPMTQSMNTGTGAARSRRAAATVHEAVELQRAISSGGGRLRGGTQRGAKAGPDALRSGCPLQAARRGHAARRATVSVSGDILFANHSFAAMLGELPIDLLRSSLESHVSAPDRERIARCCHRMRVSPI